MARVVSGCVWGLVGGVVVAVVVVSPVVGRDERLAGAFHQFVWPYESIPWSSNIVLVLFCFLFWLFSFGGDCERWPPCENVP